MTRIICLASGKGGVGKTTLTANLAAALASFKKSVVAIDGNTTTSNLGLHLGIPLYPKTLQDVIKGKASVKEVIYHHQAGFKIIPADISLHKIMTPRTHELVDVFYKLVGGSDFVLIDSAAGLGQEALAAVEAADEMITVTNPEMPSMIDALKISKLAERMETRNIGVIVNRVRGSRHELSVKDIRNFLDVQLLGHIPEDHKVHEAIAKSQPVVTYAPRSPAAQQVMAIAATLAGKKYTPRKQGMFGWLRL